MSSGALNQNWRAAIHKSGGDGFLAGRAPSKGANDNEPILGILLDLTNRKSKVKLTNHLILAVAAKVVISETVLFHADTIAAKLSNTNTSTFLAALPKNIKEDQKKNQLFYPLLLD